MASYPGAIKNFLSLQDGVDRVIAAHPNDRAGEITAIETELGIDPAGSVSDLKTRLAVAINNDGSLKTIAADKVITTSLKTAQGEVSTATNANLTLPGGEFGFYPQIKGDVGADKGITIANDREDTASYATVIFINIESGTVFAQQRYVTSSGLDHWIFLLVDKTTKDILQAYQAPDHPAYGNGGDFDKLPQPFGAYDDTKYEIVLLDKDTCNALKAESKSTGKSILTLVNEDYKPNMDKEEVYQPLHSGQFLDKTPVLIETIPDYIKVRKLTKLTDQEKTDKATLQEERKQAQIAAKATKEGFKISAKQQLKLGQPLTNDEVEALFS